MSAETLIIEGRLIVVDYDSEPDDDCTGIYIIPDTHRIVSVELLEDALYLIEGEYFEQPAAAKLRAIIDKEQS